MPDWSHTSITEFGEMKSRPMTPERLGDMSEVFGEKGVARRCFCMHWRRPDGGYDDDRDNRDRFTDVVSEERPPGLIGYVSSGPVGWVQVGPRSDFPTLERSRLFQAVDRKEVWSVNCFVVKAGHRRQGVGRGLLAAAIAFARSQGAEILEAYPVDGPGFRPSTTSPARSPCSTPRVSPRSSGAKTPGRSSGSSFDLAASNK